MTRVGASECGQRMSFKICDGVLNKSQNKGETKLPSTNRADETREMISSNSMLNDSIRRWTN